VYIVTEPACARWWSTSFGSEASSLIFKREFQHGKTIKASMHLLLGGRKFRLIKNQQQVYKGHCTPKFTYCAFDATITVLTRFSVQLCASTQPLNGTIYATQYVPSDSCTSHALGVANHLPHSRSEVQIAYRPSLNEVKLHL
jgi:hypothetical protein